MDHNTRSPRTAVEGDGKLASRAVLNLLLALSALPAVPALAQSSPPSSISERIQLNGTAAPSSRVLHVTQSIGEPLATAGPLPPQDALQGDRTQSASQTMLWAEHPRSGLGVGIGVEQRRPYGSAAMMAGQQLNQPQMEGGVLVGASLATGPRSHLVVQTPLVNSSLPRNPLLAEDPQFAQDQQRQVRMGLVFNTKKPYSDLRQGLRMELSGQTTLAIKPRGGGRLGFALQKVW